MDFKGPETIAGQGKARRSPRVVDSGVIHPFSDQSQIQCSNGDGSENSTRRRPPPTFRMHAQIQPHSNRSHYLKKLPKMKYLFISALLLALVAFSNAQATWSVYALKIRKTLIKT
jgi:hypothetical protein